MRVFAFKFFFKIIVKIFTFFLFLLLTFTNQVMAVSTDAKIIMIGFKLNSHLVQYATKNLQITYQNISDKDFLGTVAMTCGVETQKKVAEDKSILIFKDGGQETVILDIKINESGNLSCSVNIKDRDQNIINSNNLNIQIISAPNPNHRNLDNSKSKLTKISDSTDSSNSDLEISAESSSENFEIPNIFSEAKDLYLNLKGKVTDTFSSSTATSDNLMSKVQNLDKNKLGWLNDVNQTKDTFFSKLNKLNVFSFWENGKKDSQENSNQFQNFILKFFTDLFYSFYNLVAGIVQKLFTYLLPPGLSVWVGQYWLGILIFLWLLLALKKRGKRIFKSEKKFDDERDYLDEIDLENQQDRYRRNRGKIRRRNRKENYDYSDEDYDEEETDLKQDSDLDKYSIKENIQERKKEINNRF